MRRPESLTSNAQASLVEPAPHSLGDIYLQARQLQSDMLAGAVANGLEASWRLLRRAATGLGEILGNQGRRATIRELRRLDARMLRDIGIDPDDIEGTVATLQRRSSARRPGQMGDTIRQLDRLSAPQHRADRVTPPAAPANTDAPMQRSA